MPGGSSDCILAAKSSFAGDTGAAPELASGGTMTRSQIIVLVGLVCLLAVLALPARARADAASDGWTWDESAATAEPAPDGWTWDESAAPADPAPDGATSAESAATAEPAPDGWTWDESAAPADPAPDGGTGDGSSTGGEPSS
jgi:hypothetical protein